MSESIAELRNRLENAITPGFRERLLDRGLARGLLWSDGTLPAGTPVFSDSLTEDLLDYAHGILTMALRLRSQDSATPTLLKAFLVAGEAIEAAVHSGDASRLDRGFNRVSAAVAFHLARYAARAYSILPNRVDHENLAPTEIVLVQLLRRSLDEMHANIAAWLLSDDHEDSMIASRLRDDVDFDEVDAIHTVLATSFMRGLALFDHALTTGEKVSALEAKRRLMTTAKAAGDLHAVSHWWTSTLASHLIDELWTLSLYQQLPVIFPVGNNGEKWNSLRLSYIQRLHSAKRSEIELWPSQIEAASRAVDITDDLVVALPTSAGKTRIAEFCILMALASDQRVVYVTPLRALSAQVERDLAKTFLPLGFPVSTLYGSGGIGRADLETLRKRRIVVSTPERLDFALRNDPTIIENVGLIVLDEGHMLGPNEREVRYEALVQRLLRRPDARNRRIVCLSALFPAPGEMEDLVAWIRQDEPGEPVHSDWRPTRQRFGILKWTSNGARLDVRVEGENPFVQNFIKAEKPPTGSRRRNNFPNNKNELTLAAAWRFVEQGKRVLVYCAMRKSVGRLGGLILKSIRQGVLKPLRDPNERIFNAMNIGYEWLGTDHPAVQCLHYGIVLHHAGLPRPFLNEVEQILRSEDCSLTIASPTIAQGLNLSASVLLVPSIWRNQKVIEAQEFANVTGRAGRAFVDLEGLILHIIWEPVRGRDKRAVSNWEELVAKTKAPAIASGLLQLTRKIFRPIADAIGGPLEEVIEYVTGHEDAWDFSDVLALQANVTADEWNRDIATLDAAILAMMEPETEPGHVDSQLCAVLEGSLFSRQLAREEEDVQRLLRGFLAARVNEIWTRTSPLKRRGYHLAGVGLRTGLFLDANIADLIAVLLRAETAIVLGEALAAAEAVIEFARLVFQTAPFRPSATLNPKWEDALRGWIKGEPASDVVGIEGDNGVDLLQDVLTYRLPWAMEAVRVHAAAVGQESADQLRGIAAMVVEAGSANVAVVTLLRAGLISREAAMAAVASTGASFDDRSGMFEWLRSENVQELSTHADWPTEQSRYAWLQFLDCKEKGSGQKWKRETQMVRVDWTNAIPAVGAHVVIEAGQDLGHGIIMTPDMTKLGILRSSLRKPRRDIVSARVGDNPGTVKIEYFGPSI
ncbi:MAG: DEAD/DEAH box helicase [Desulfomonilaceae bacterium]